MKRLILAIVLIQLTLVVAIAQEQKLDLLVADSTWLKEIIKFPFDFAPELPYQGYEDLRFAKHWRNPDGNEFFSYAYIWNINLSVLPTAEGIENDMLLYYDGLMTAVNKDKGFIIPKTKATFIKKETINNLPHFKGTMQVYDSFVTKKVTTLYVNVETLYCTTQKRYILFFKVSAESFNKPIWQKFEALKFVDNFCENKP